MARTEPVDATKPTKKLGPDFYKLWVASAISNFGDGVRLTAIPLLAATLTREPGLIAGVTFASTIPWLLFALTAGALVDRLDRRQTMWTMQVFRLVLMVGLSIIIILDLTSTGVLVSLYLVSFLLGVGEVMFDNAAQAIMPSVVRKDQLQVANGRLYAAEEVFNRFAGPPAGSFLFVAAAALPFIVDAVSFGLGAILILSMAGSFRPARAADAPRTRLRTEVSEGLRWLWNHKLLRTLGIMTGVHNLTSNATFSLFVLYALEILDLSAEGFGILLAAMAIGGFVGSLTGPHLARLFGDGVSFYVITLGAAAVNLVIGLTSSAIVVGVVSIALGIGIAWWNVIAVSLRQSVVPDRLLGRVNSVYRLLAWGTMPLGAALGGLLGELFGLRSPYFVAAVLLVGLALYMLPIVSDRSIAQARAEAD